MNFETLRKELINIALEQNNEKLFKELTSGEWKNKKVTKVINTEKIKEK
jgi:hypothetical protein